MESSMIIAGDRGVKGWSRAQIRSANMRSSAWMSMSGKPFDGVVVLVPMTAVVGGRVHSNSWGSHISQQGTLNVPVTESKLCIYSY